MTTFFTSDTHFGHSNIIKYCNRPFSTIEEMDELLIKKWNSVVQTTDTVYHLGDFAFKNPKAYKDRLNGDIVLIRGNHDYKLKSNEKIFKSIHDLLSIKIKNITITLCHYSMRVWPKSHFNHWHLYGHSHGTLCSYGKSFDVGVDNNNFSPISFQVIERIIASKSNNPNWLRNLKGFNEKEFNEAKKLIDMGYELD